MDVTVNLVNILNNLGIYFSKVFKEELVMAFCQKKKCVQYDKLYITIKYTS